MMADTGAGKTVSKRELFTELWTNPRARSRNANFARYRDDREYRNVVRHVRSLLVFLNDLERYDGRCTVEVHRLASGRGAQITFRVPELSLKRFLYVTSYELDHVRRDPRWQRVASDSHAG